MLLSLVLHSYSMRYLLPGVVLLGTAPTYVLAWGFLRLVSALLPARFYQRMDDRLYCVYQSMVLFFFENYTGVQVRSARACRARCGTRAAGTRVLAAREAARGLLAGAPDVAGEAQSGGRLGSPLGAAHDVREWVGERVRWRRAEMLPLSLLQTPGALSTCGWR